MLGDVFGVPAKIGSLAQDEPVSLFGPVQVARVAGHGSEMRHAPDFVSVDVDMLGEGAGDGIDPQFFHVRLHAGEVSVGQRARQCQRVCVATTFPIAQHWLDKKWIIMRVLAAPAAVLAGVPHVQPFAIAPRRRPVRQKCALAVPAQQFGQRLENRPGFPGKTGVPAAFILLRETDQPFAARPGRNPFVFDPFADTGRIQWARPGRRIHPQQTVRALVRLDAPADADFHSIRLRLAGHRPHVRVLPVHPTIRVAQRNRVEAVFVRCQQWDQGGNAQWSE